MDAPLFRLVAQRTAGDCGVAVLASLAHVTYEEALVALSQEDPSVIYSGAYLTAIAKAAKSFDLTLKRRLRYDLETDTGILYVCHPQWTAGHVVLLHDGKIYDGLDCWDADVYLRHKRAKPGALLVEA